MKSEPINPTFLKLGEYIVPTIVSLAIISSLILVYYVMTDTGNVDTTATVTTPTPSAIDADQFEIKVLKEGSGAQIKAGQTAEVHYVGTLKTTGAKFDSSYDRNETFSFELGSGEVIQGWDKGVEGMKIGEKRKLTIPASLGYGASGAGGVIPPNATLIFEVELVAIK
jgi:FKBP-type peptidyl-prolyl cis-trans isomerase